MKLTTKHITLMLVAFFVSAGSLFAQSFTRDLQYFTNPDQRGLNQFEAPFMTEVEFDGLVVRIGGANALQFQGLTQENDADNLQNLESNFNLATSNLDLDVGLANGLRMHLRTYLSSQHHTETYVKGGYMQVDRLDFISEGLASDLMDHVRIKVGHMELNYGDNHFRRSDNAAAIHNPFVGNYLMDSFTTEVAGELYYYQGGFMAMFGLSNGKLNQSVEESAIKTKPTVYGKLAYDQTFDDGLRFRLSGSILRVGQSSSIYLYSGDRAGARYYDVIEGGNFRSGRIAPSFTPGRGATPAAGEMTSFMLNPFVKFGGLEFYGVFENATGKIETEADSRSYNQYAAELLYRFGANEDLYLGARYNFVDGETQSGDIEVDRFNIGGGWFLTRNVLAKFEYVTQNYDGDGYAGTDYAGASFDGVMLEAIISF
ncbi:porin [Balneolaceae bacterium YR4-1]|uniref:Porin n=1 Tax=Halalkalibaculum roseum TaxID=2709311 RepID=A0A6M1T6C4_9BACT|nr:porin [Halalkalibaculum roseum]NGP77505.1 porin [Halalkalibaculum roseum]